MIAEPPCREVGIIDSGALRVQDDRYALEREMVEREFLSTAAWKDINALEEAIEAHPDCVRELPLNHLFPKGQYVRQIFMPKGTLLTTRVHLTEHPFFVMRGAVSVWTDGERWKTYVAGDAGITQPGTRRVLLIHEDCIWATCMLNPDNEMDPDKIVERVTYDHRKLKLGTPPGTTNEQWRPVVGYEGRYEVSDLGRVRSVNYRGSGTFLVMKQADRRGYRSVLLTGATTPKEKWNLVHRLVTAAFIGQRPNGLDVNHKNGIKHDNRPKNLEYCTKSENTRHSFALGLQCNKGSRHSQAKLTEDDIPEVFRQIESGRTQDEVGNMFGVGQAVISRIIHNKSWVHVNREGRAL